MKNKISPSQAIMQGIASYLSHTTSDYLLWKDLDKGGLIKFLTERNVDKELSSSRSGKKLTYYAYGLEGLMAFFKAHVDIKVVEEEKHIEISKNGVMLYCVSAEDIEFLNFNSFCFDMFATGGSVVSILETVGQEENIQEPKQTKFIA